MAVAEHYEMPFWFRQFLSWSLKSAGIETVPERAANWPDYFDNTEGIGEVKRTLFYKDKRSGIFLPFKGRAKPVEAETKIGVEAHITAIAYGTTKRARRFWINAIKEGLVSLETARKFGFTGEPANDADYLASATRMALHQRFWKVPYHWVGLLNGDIIHNNIITRYTHHGNGGNGPLVGASLEGSYPGLEKNRKAKHNGYDDFTIETGRATIRLAVEHSRDQGAPIQFLYAHRQYSSGRLGDPGEGWWKEIGLPMAAELKLEIRYRFKHGSGNQIPVEWDESGLVDYRGRPIKKAA